MKLRDDRFDDASAVRTVPMLVRLRQPDASRHVDEVPAKRRRVDVAVIVRPRRTVNDRIVRHSIAEPAQLAILLAGPTCDSIDVIAENLMLPELKAGDLIVGRAMGAYTWASASEFNFYPKASVVAVNQRPGDLGSITALPP